MRWFSNDRRRKLKRPQLDLSYFLPMGQRDALPVQFGALALLFLD
jgi:hypothetical protein